MTEAAPILPAVDRARTGMRLQRCEVLNWGTFHGAIWGLDLNGDNALLTGDIGSGKSTLVDALTTLLVPAQKIAYNKAAGAEARERDLRSYVFGYFKSERGDGGYAAKPVGLRDHRTCSVILGRFRNEAFGQDVTLAQVFWFREPQGQRQYRARDDRRDRGRPFRHDDQWFRNQKESGSPPGNVDENK